MRRVEARFFRFWANHSALLGRFLLALWLVWCGLAGLLVTRATFSNGPLDWSAQSLSIMSVGRLTFETAPRVIGVLDLILAALLWLGPQLRVTPPLLFGRLVLAFLPLVMLRDDLWHTFPLKPSGAGWGTLGFVVILGVALGISVRSRWRALQTPPILALLEESEFEAALRRRQWRRFAIVTVPLVLAIAIATPFVWPRYLSWFHARQEASVLNVKMAGQLLKKSMPPSRILDGRKITTWVYLPPNYAHSRLRYPVVYVMHGMPGEVRDCFVKGEIQDAAEDLIIHHQIRPLIIVGWDGQGPGGPADVTNYLDRPDYKMESFMLDELIPYIDHTYRTIPKAPFRALDGISAGGYAAPNLVFKYPEVWKVASSHNGFFSPDEDVENMTAILGPRGPLWDANNPMKTVAQRGPLDDLHVYLDIGQGDDLQADFSRFAREVKAHGIDCNAHIFPGRHTWAYWSEHFYDSLRFADKSFHARPSGQPLLPMSPLIPTPSGQPMLPMSPLRPAPSGQPLLPMQPLEPLLPQTGATRQTPVAPRRQRMRSTIRRR